MNTPLPALRPPEARTVAQGTFGISIATDSGPIQVSALRQALALLDALPFPATWIGSGHRVLWVNKAAATAPDLAGAPCYQAAYGYDSPCATHAQDCPMESAKARGRVARTLHIHPTTAGHGLFEVTALPIADGSVLELRMPLPAALTEDPLTGLLSRRAGATLVERTFQLLRRLPQPVSLLMLDLDRFKAVNDTHGHDAGDRVLAAVGRAIRAAMRETDVAVRWGGEEFLIMLPGTSREGAVICAERLLAAVRALRVSIRATSLVITASIGVWSGYPRTSAEAAIRSADHALLEAKSQGRGRWMLATPLGTARPPS